MSRSWILFVAGRVLRSSSRSGGGAAKLAVFGVAAGVATLIVVLAVMNGFQFDTIESILEINSFHLRIETGRSLDDNESVAASTALSDRLGAIEGVRTSIPTIEIQTLARGFWPEPQGIVIRAVPADWLEEDADAARRMETVQGAFDLNVPDGVVLGAELARALGVRVTDPIRLSHIPGGGARPREQELTVVGLFRTGYLDLDRNWAFVSLETAARSLPSRDQVVIAVKLRNRYDVAPLADRIRAVLPGSEEIVSWREYNRGIFGALRVEKTMMVLLIGLIFLVVAGNIYQLLRRSILERSEDIAILRALGAPPGSLRLVFLLEGALIGVIGTLAGVATGLFLSRNLTAIFAVLESIARLASERGIRAFSPSYFYIQGVPSRIVPMELYMIAFVSLVIATGASALATRGVDARSELELLRAE